MCQNTAQFVYLSKLGLVLGHRSDLLDLLNDADAEQSEREERMAVIQSSYEQLKTMLGGFYELRSPQFFEKLGLQCFEDVENESEDRRNNENQSKSLASIDEDDESGGFEDFDPDAREERRETKRRFMDFCSFLAFEKTESLMLDAGELLYEAGEEGLRLFVILDGLVEVIPDRESLDAIALAEGRGSLNEEDNEREKLKVDGLRKKEAALSLDNEEEKADGEETDEASARTGMKAENGVP